MRHDLSDVNIKVDIPTKDLETLIEKATDAALTIIAAATAAHILKQFFTKETP
jgi:hypothetical protein